MSLTVWVGVNDRPVAFVAARRTTNLESQIDQAEDVNAYEVRLFKVGDDGTVERQMGDMVEVLHTFGDGPVALAAKAIQAGLAQ